MDGLSGRVSRVRPSAGPSLKFMKDHRAFGPGVACGSRSGQLKKRRRAKGRRYKEIECTPEVGMESTAASAITSPSGIQAGDQLFLAERFQQPAYYFSSLH